MFGRKHTNLGSSFGKLLGNRLINDIKQNMYADRPRPIPNEPEFSIPLLPKHIRNSSISIEMYNALPMYLKHSWQRIDLNELFKDPNEDLK